MFLRALLIIALGIFAGNLAVAQDLKVDVAAVRELISNWNKAHNISTVETLSSLYADTVDFYGSIVTRRICVSLKRARLERQKDFTQELKNELVLIGYSSGAIRCEFVNTVSSNGTSTDDRSYLIVKRILGNYFIVGESDFVTDRNTKHEPDLGTKVKIRQVKYNTDFADWGEREPIKIIILCTSLVVGLIGLWIVLRKWRRFSGYRQVTVIDHANDPRNETSNPTVIAVPVSESSIRGTKRIISKIPERIVNSAEREILYEKGLAFEKFIVRQFAKRRNDFTLMEWRSDKFHEGIFPQSNRDPDLEYKYLSMNFSRKFSIECKYRSKVFNNSIQLMDENKYRIYKVFHRTKMPVYIALGVGGSPDNPEKLYLIPFDNVKLEMPVEELSKYRKRPPFSYNMRSDRLT